ncbi:patatin-like phospholipase family protein [Leifsonia poae]|uniref:patatin-like phospholipase family protein n=1 Tax=Leifsonia poae TaxID=110933 RepID=UPI001CBFEF54|nr:patatin-like phospholipase family protein [Leifsonia poae]
MAGSIAFAGGGVAGIAWELGVVNGLADADPRLVEALFAPEVGFIGTSAGSAVAAQLASGRPVAELYAAQLAPETAEFDPRVDMQALMASYLAIADPDATPEEGRRRIGGLALAAKTVTEAERMVSIEARLPIEHWPERRMLLTAIDAGSGELRVFDAASGVRLADAVAASCAVPGVWPPVTIGDRRYIDGGMRSLANADLAVGSDWVLVIAPILPGGPGFGQFPAEELEALRPAPVAVVYADDASVAAFGVNPLDPHTRRPAAEAGFAVGRAAACGIGERLGLR